MYLLDMNAPAKRHWTQTVLEILETVLYNVMLVVDHYFSNIMVVSCTTPCLLAYFTAQNTPTHIHKPTDKHYMPFTINIVGT